ncbi:hypothetical protein J6590_082831 [Homalodisca vitripennis]|nr:hypothetical protein J6590_082831 [Homalodisca vitripennis]
MCNNAPLFCTNYLESTIILSAAQQCLAVLYELSRIYHHTLGCPTMFSCFVRTISNLPSYSRLPNNVQLFCTNYLESTIILSAAQQCSAVFTNYLESTIILSLPNNVSCFVRTIRIYIYLGCPTMFSCFVRTISNLPSYSRLPNNVQLFCTNYLESTIILSAAQQCSAVFYELSRIYHHNLDCPTMLSCFVRTISNLRSYSQLPNNAQLFCRNYLDSTNILLTAQQCSAVLYELSRIYHHTLSCPTMFSCFVRTISNQPSYSQLRNNLKLRTLKFYSYAEKAVKREALEFPRRRLKVIGGGLKRIW